MRCLLKVEISSAVRTILLEWGERTFDNLRRREVSGRRGTRFSPPIGKLLLATDLFTVEAATVRRLVARQ